MIQANAVVVDFDQFPILEHEDILSRVYWWVCFAKKGVGPSE